MRPRCVRDASGARPARTPLADRDGHPAPWLTGMFGPDARAFLLCGGPSVRGMDLRPLVDRRGFLLMAVNNAPAVLEPGYLRPDLWTHVDSAGSFLDHLWRDPGVMKFTPGHKMATPLREKRPDGRLARIRTGPDRSAPPPTPHHCPNAWGYRRHAGGLDPATFLSDPLVSWGTAQHADGPIGDGSDRDTRSVLLVALRLLYELGVREVYLLGADFFMGRGPGNQYAFSQAKDDAAAVRSNNRKFAVLARWLALLRPHFEQAGFFVYNAGVGSHLDAFDRIGYDDAVARAQGPCGTPVDGSNWYTS